MIESPNNPDTHQQTDQVVATATTPVIKLTDVHKRYGSLQVLSGLSLQVNRGEVYGFLGRNGAGKSTAIRLMMGISKVNSGHIELFGHDVSRNVISVRQRIGYVAQEQHFYPWMTPRSLGKFVRGFYPRWDQKRYTDLLVLFELPAKRKVGLFSGGMKAKMALTMALATRPDCLILDEPTAGMDPVARREFLDLVSDEARRADTTILFSTHVIDDIEAIADRIGIVESGHTVYEGALAPLYTSIATYSIDEQASFTAGLPGEFGVDAARVLQETTRAGRRTLVLQFQNGTPSRPVLHPGWRQDSMSLEDVFIAVVGKSN